MSQSSLRDLIPVANTSVPPTQVRTVLSNDLPVSVDRDVIRRSAPMVIVWTNCHEDKESTSYHGVEEETFRDMPMFVQHYLC